MQRSRAFIDVFCCFIIIQQASLWDKRFFYHGDTLIRYCTLLLWGLLVVLSQGFNGVSWCLLLVPYRIIFENATKLFFDEKCFFQAVYNINQLCSGLYCGRSHWKYEQSVQSANAWEQKRVINVDMARFVGQYPTSSSIVDMMLYLALSLCTRCTTRKG